MLIDTFINAIFLYDDKMAITFNYKEGTKTITLAELPEAISNKTVRIWIALLHQKTGHPFGGVLFFGICGGLERAATAQLPQKCVRWTHF